jgi:hypothetical protein
MPSISGIMTVVHRGVFLLREEAVPVDPHDVDEQSVMEKRREIQRLDGKA